MESYIYRGNNAGVCRVSNDHAIIKTDCGSHSRLSTTQKNTKKMDKTISFERQVDACRNVRYLEIFHNYLRLDHTKTKKHGFEYVDTITLKENEHTSYSVNPSTEYLSVFCKPRFKKRMSEKVKMMRDILSIRAQCGPRTLNNNDWIMKRFRENPDMYTTNCGITPHQKEIVDMVKKRFTGDIIYSNVGCSKDYALYAGPPNKKNVRQHSGKVQAMTAIVLIDPTTGHDYKLNAAGFMLLRGIIETTPTQVSKWLEVARHAVHPEYIQLIREIIS